MLGLFAPAEGPFDDATNKSVIKLLPRKPTAIKERPGDRRRKFGYIEIRAQLAARLCARRNHSERGNPPRPAVEML